MTLRIVVKGGGESFKEGNVATTFKPGHLVARNGSGNLIPQAATGPVPIRVAVEQTWVGGTRDDAYAVNSQALYQDLHAGDEVYLRIAAAGAAIAYGDYLESAGDGTIRKATDGGTRATVTIGAGNGALTVTSRLPGNAGNGISIAISAASGGGSVTVNNGNDIVVVPAAAADTATAVAAQIAANATANALVTATAGGTGASAIGTTAATSLAGGTEGGAGSANLQALEAVDNSGGATEAFIRAEVL